VARAEPRPGRPPGAAGGGALSAGDSALLHAGFFLTGMATVLLGPAIPELAAAWQVPATRLAPLFVAQFSASSLGAVLSSFRPRRSLLAGYPALAAGLAGLGFGGPELAVAAAACLGLGLGLTIPASNLLIAAAFPERRGAALSILNLLWGAGALSCPLLFAVLRGRVGPTAALAGLAAAAALVAIALVARRRRVPPPAAGVPPLAAPAGASTGRWTLVLFAAMLFLYVGAESATGGWLVALADQLGGRTSASMLVGSAFWLALLGGRALAPWVLRRVSEPRLQSAALALAAAGTCGLLLAGSHGGLAAAAAVAGLGLSVVFPLTVAALAAATQGAGARTVGWVFALGGAGGAVVPWLAAQVAAPDSLQRGFAVPLAAIALLGVLHGLHRFLATGAAATAGDGPGGPADPRGPSGPLVE
jgi:MFS transporter, FHS family, glucose/mannose:H+ symporter